MKDCKACAEKEKPELIEEYFKERWEKEEERVQTTALEHDEDSNESSIFFKTVFAHRHDI